MEVPTDFKDGIRSSAEYAYDLNGNLIQDLNKGISRIRYNCLNLPSAIEFTDGRTISYLYSADGTKLEVIHAMGDSITTTDYCGKAIYENEVSTRFFSMVKVLFLSRTMFPIVIISS